MFRVRSRERKGLKGVGLAEGAIRMGHWVEKAPEGEVLVEKSPPPQPPRFILSLSAATCFEP